MPRIPLAALASLAAAALVLPACGGDDLNPDAVAQAARRTSATGGMRIVIDGKMTLPGAGTVPYTLRGESDLRNRRAHMTFDMSKLAGLGGVQGIDANDLRGESVLDGGTMYMRFPVLTDRLPGNEHWVKIDLERAAGIDLGQLQQTNSMDPGAQLDFLRATGDVKKAGSATVDGVPTTHYKATVDLRRYPDAVPESQRAAARRVVDRVVRAGAATRYPVDVFIDREGLLRRQIFRLNQPASPGSGQRIRMTFDMHMRDFGARVNVTPPPASDVRDLTDIAKNALAKRG